MDTDLRRDVKAFIIDADGVLYRGQERLPGAHTFLQTLQRENVPYVLLTNNSTRTVDQYVEKLAHMGIEVDAGQIITSAVATALYLAARAEPGTPIYVLGMEGLEKALQAQGFVVTEESPEYVVAGLDAHVTYEKLSIAALAIRAGATFIGSNPDRTLPTERGLEPGAGSILAAIETATDVAPKIIGKPESGVFEIALKKLGIAPDQTAMIGDRLETDILGGARAGLRTILVLTGVTAREDLRDAGVQPDLVYDDLEQLLAAWG